MAHFPLFSSLSGTQGLHLLLGNAHGNLTLWVKRAVLGPLVSPLWPLHGEAWPGNGSLSSKHSEPGLLFLITEHG